MKRVIISVHIKGLALSIIAFFLFIISISILLVGIGDKGGVNRNEDNSITKYSIKPNDITFNDKNGGGPKVRVYISKGKKVEELFLEEYVRGVVSAEMPASYDLEALKAQAVAARTYTIAHMKSFGGKPKDANYDLDDTVQSQVYINKENRLSSWPEKERGQYWNKITDAVQQTTGQVLTYDGKIVKEPFYFAVSSGKTENSVDVFSSSEPYLRSVSSPGEEEAQKYKTTTKFTYKELSNKLNSQISRAGTSSSKLKSQLGIISRNEGGSVKEIKVGKEVVSGVEFRKILGLNSANFIITFRSNTIDISCTGYGHGVGMSQNGANVMAKSGKKYNDILQHYYSGVKIEKVENLVN